MALPGETEAGSAGKQPCPGIVRRAHRDDDHGRGNERLAPTLHPIGSKDPDALKIPARRAASTLTRSVRSPVLADPAQVHLSVGGAPRSPRLYRGRDVVAWLDEMGYYDLPIDEHPKKDTVRTKTNHYVTGRDGGREIDLRKLALEGMRLYGHFKDIRNGYLKFGNDLKENLDSADEVAGSIKTSIDNYIKENQIDTPTEAPYVPVWQPSNPLLELACEEAGITAVVWCTGVAPDFSWIEIPVFDGKGYPGHKRGVTGMRGLYFLGLPWLYTWGSARFSGIAQDAAHVADRIALNLRAHQPRAASRLNEGAIGS